MLEKPFRLKENATSIGKGYLAGVSTFLATAYITTVSPGIFLLALFFSPLAMMPLTCSIAVGIAIGFITYALPKTCTGKGKEIKTSTSISSPCLFYRDRFYHKFY